MNLMDKIFSDLNVINPDPYPWMLDKEFVLVKSMDQLQDILDKAVKAGVCALDLETEGLDNRIKQGRTVHQIVGYCLSYDGHTGYYVPVRHFKKNIKSGVLTLSKANLPPLLVAEKIKDLCRDARIIYHNSSFDLEFLYGSEAHVPDPNKDQFEDTMILDYLKDSTAKQHGLKHLSKEYLGMEMIELKDLFPKSSKDKNFSLLDPTLTSTLYYAGSDAICTYLLWEHLKDYGHKEQKAVYDVERAVVNALRWTERNRMTVDMFYTENLLDEIVQMTKECQDTIYADLATSLQLDEDAVRTLYDINSPQQLGKALVSLQSVDRNFAKIELERTENSGQVKTNNEAMDKLTSTYGDQFPFLALVKKMRSLQKVEGTYVRPIFENADPQDNTIRFSFQAHRVDTGRFSASKGKVGQGYSGINVQSVPAPYLYSKFYVKRIKTRPTGMGDAYATLEPTFKKALDDGFLKRVYDGHFIRDNRTGDDLCVRTSCEGCPFANECDHEAAQKHLVYSVEQAVRPALIAPEGFVLVGIDYSGLELRAVANLCEEPRWIDEFYRCGTCKHEFQKPTKIAPKKWRINEVPPSLCPTCGSDKIGDLHTLTAQIIWGDDVVNLPGSAFKQKRQQSKGVNFAIIYGGGGGAIARATDVDSKEGFKIREKILKGLPVFNKWMENVIHDAHRNLEVETAIGRKIRLWDINSSESFIKAKQERNAVNSIVQGSATGDLIKYAMAKVYDEVKKRSWLDVCRMVLTVHDELVFEIRQDMLDEVLPVINDCMVKFAVLKKWAIPLVTDVEFNTNWSPNYNWTLMHSLSPKTGLAEEGIPDFLMGKVGVTKGMWYLEDGEKRVWDGSSYCTEKVYTEAFIQNLNKNVTDDIESHITLNPETPPTKVNTDMTLVNQFTEGSAKPKTKTATLPFYEYKTYASMPSDDARASYMLRLRRVMEGCRILQKLGRGDVTHTLKVVTATGVTILPPQKVVEVDPKVFDILALYEGL